VGKKAMGSVYCHVTAEYSPFKKHVEACDLLSLR
jgi:hypothetical protein